MFAGLAISIVVLAATLSQAATALPDRPIAASRPTASLPADQPSDANQPAALLELERYRSSRLKRASIEWSEAYYKADAKQPWQTLHYRSEIADGDVAVVMLGDDDGVVQRDGYGRTTRGDEGALLTRDHDLWTRDADMFVRLKPGTPERPPQDRVRPPQGDIAERRDITHDIRTIDLIGGGSLATALFKNHHLGGANANIRYQQKRDGDMLLITATTRVGRAEVDYRWRLDPSRGHSPTRVEWRRDSRLIWSHEIALRQYGDVWLPHRVEKSHFDRTSKCDQRRVVTLTHVKIGADLPDRLSPQSIGIESGCNVMVSSSEDAPAQLLMWDGNAAVSLNEYTERLKRGDAVPSDRMASLFNGELGELNEPDPGTPEGRMLQGLRQSHHERWTRYTEQFIASHQLSAEQSESARGVLADCMHRADDQMRLLRPQITKLARSIESPAMGAVAAHRQRKQQARWRAQLDQPIDAIFNDQLEPRLRSLLNKSQSDRRVASEPGQ